MTDRVYTTAMGKPIDMGALAIKNQNTPAVGNMKVDAGGKPIKPAVPPPDARPAVAQVQPGRITNVQRVPVDATTADARLRLDREAAEHQLHIERERMVAESAATVTREPEISEPEPIVMSDEVIPEEISIESTMMFSAEPDPLSMELQDEVVVSATTQPSGLAAAVQRAQARRDVNDV